VVGAATVTVTSVNDPPISASATIVTNEDTVSARPRHGGGPRRRQCFAIVTQPTHGTAVVFNSQLIYTPDANYNGADSFTSARATAPKQWSARRR